MEKEGRKKVTTAGIIGFVIAFIISFVVVSYLTKGSDDNYEALLKMSETLNKSYPAQIDNDTRLDSTGVQKEPLTLSYYYTVVTVDKNALTVNMQDVVKELKKGTQQNLDTAPEMAEFRDRNVSLKYCYYDKKGAFLVDYTIKPSKQPVATE